MGQIQGWFGSPGSLADTFLYWLYGMFGAITGSIISIIVAATFCYTSIVVFLLVLQALGFSKKLK